jgi:hypothetical protein
MTKTERITAEEWLAKIKKEENAKKKKALNELKDIGVELYAKGITKFECEYNGEGDSGDIDYHFYEKNKAFGAHDKNDIPAATADKLLEICWIFVPSGFENNEGGYGSVSINFKDKTISLSHNDRIVDVKTTEENFNFNGEEIVD